MPFSKKIVLDTNFLLIPGQFKVDIFEEIQKLAHFNYKLYIFENTQKELEKIIETGKLTDKTAAKIAKQLILLKKINIIKQNPRHNVDDAIVELALKEEEVYIATQDLELKKRLKGKKIIILKSKKYLAFA